MSPGPSAKPCTGPSPSRRQWLGLAAAGPVVQALPSWAQSEASARVNTRSTAPRLITVGGAITEMVYALGAQALLVGSDSTSAYPAAAQALPKVGYLRQLSAEGLLSLRPSVLVTSADAGPPVVLEQVRSAGVRVIAVPASHDWEEVRRKLAAVGEATQAPSRAAELMAQLDAQWQQVTARVAAQARAKPAGRVRKVLFILAHAASPSVSGSGTAAHALIGLMGARNAISGFEGYRPLTAEAMAQAAPDVILTSTEGLQAQGGIERFWARPEMALAPAYQRRALVHRDALQLLGFGPRLPQVVQQLHQEVMAA
jgi:iron complex transport system substrate-binding protein